MAVEGFTLEYYENLIRGILVKTHACPNHVVAALTDEYRDVIKACWQAGVAAVVQAKLLYADWQIFHRQ